ncbi:transcriptional regulator [Flavivirga aquatica]|uniref:Transcriptional regulator n=1 Tax=Flavivirga aquatica TaxID=1849968 RepID=A0A1E5TBH7_9FLAO|nr:LysR family transcriptional regulator [Flavivirga aquatica]OEK08735.1 transcriptional regulator [Flavivirga aquatica]
MGNQIELRHIKNFLVVAKDLHFRKAAERLFISQPGLSRQIKQMEEELGLKLFVRHNRKVVLTQAGIYLKKELARNLKDLRTIFNHAKLLNDGVEGLLKFGYVGSAMQKIIPDLLIKLNKETPNIHFSLKEMDNQKQIDSLISNNIDLGFVRLNRVPRSLNIKPVLKESFCLVLPYDHPINESNFKSLKQFKDASFILFDPKYSASYFEKVMQIFDDNHFTPIVSHNTIHASSIYKLIENKLGISIVPKSLLITSNSKIKFIELNKISQKTTLSLIWHKDNRNPILNKVVKLI